MDLTTYETIELNCSVRANGSLLKIDVLGSNQFLASFFIPRPGPLTVSLVKDAAASRLKYYKIKARNCEVKGEL